MTRQNQLIAGGIAILIIILGIGGYLLFGRNQFKNLQTNMNQPQSSASGNSTIQSSVTDLFTSGDTKQCTFDVTGASGGNTKGTIYVSGNKAYGSFAMTATGKTTTTNLIRNDSTFYVWGDALPTGVKMTMNVNDMAAKMQGGQYSAFNPNEKVNYNCAPWSVDASKFNPPTAIKFMDAGAINSNDSGVPTTKTGAAVDPCAQITDANSKAACENAMHH